LRPVRAALARQLREGYQPRQRSSSALTYGESKAGARRNEKDGYYSGPCLFHRRPCGAWWRLRRTLYWRNHHVPATRYIHPAWQRVMMRLLGASLYRSAKESVGVARRVNEEPDYPPSVVDPVDCGGTQTGRIIDRIPSLIIDAGLYTNPCILAAVSR